MYIILICNYFGCQRTLCARLCPFVIDVVACTMKNLKLCKWCGNITEHKLRKHNIIKK